jgi:endonuclease/exonuclease/phosphatase (EEP) superfamily protein YafD
MLVLFLPWLLCFLILIAVVALVRKNWILTVILLFVVFLLNWSAECIPLRLWPFSEHDNGKSFKVVSFNMDGTEGDIRTKAPGIVSLIERYSPDVLFLTEYCENDGIILDTLLRKTYPYSTRNKKSRFSYFFSKYPLSEAKHLVDSLTRTRVGIYTCKVYLNADTVVLYGCHLPSNNYTKELKNLHPESIGNCNNLLEYMKDISFAYDLRTHHVEVMEKHVDGITDPIIVMGDMNDVGGSAAIRKIESSGLKDAWWQGGLGYGATIHSPLPYRIDHIFYSDDLEMQRIKVVDSGSLSDHDVLYAEFIIKK